SVQINAVPLMGRGVIRVELNRSSEALLGFRPIPHIQRADLGQRRMSLGEPGVYFQRPCRRGLSHGKGITGPSIRVDWDYTVGIRQPRVSQGVRRVGVRRLPEVLDRPLQPLARPLIPEVPAFEVKLVSLRVVRVTLGQPLLFLTG